MVGTFRSSGARLDATYVIESLKAEHSCRDKTKMEVWEITGFRKQLSSVLLAPAGGDQSWLDRLNQHDNRTHRP